VAEAFLESKDRSADNAGDHQDQAEEGKAVEDEIGEEVH
jgi:hypothetical protein